MKKIISQIQHSLVFKLILIMGCICLVAIATWAFFTIRYQRNKSLDDNTDIADRISKTIRLGTHYSMMLNSRDDINQIIKNTATQKGIENVRITNKSGEIKFSNIPSEVDRTEEMTSWTCQVCHQTSPPLVKLSLAQRRRLFQTSDGERQLGIITPIYNEPGCSEKCHFHNSEDKVLGALDVVISLKDTDAEIIKYEQSIFLLAVAIIIVPSLCIFLFVYKFVIHPLGLLTEETRHITDRNGRHLIKTDPHSEIGQLATAFHTMRRRIFDNQMELTKQKNEYQTLFENVPCLITVQNRDFKLINFNREFYTKYNPSPGDYCYQAYKGRKTKCDNCPVEKTFADGKSHYSEELGRGRDGTMEHWIVRTSPVRDTRGNIVAAMEINLDITQRKLLEQRAEASEKKYHAIFNNIPNPVFVLDYDTLKILNCNESVKQVYGYPEKVLLGKSFITLFAQHEDTPLEDPQTLMETIKKTRIMNKAWHKKNDDVIIPVDIWISLSEYPGQKVLLVTTSDITHRLETEAQFNQAAKLATLGEMATGVAHELNQPLSVIKTSSSFCRSKIEKEESIKPDILHRLLVKIDSNVDRASRIITHMRDFSRKSDTNLQPVEVNGILRNAYEIFSQQLKVRGIEVSWDLGKDLPSVMADPGRLEQVFINLLINARDAIEEKTKMEYHGLNRQKEISVKSYNFVNHQLIIEIKDTGTGIPDQVAEKIFQPFFTTKEVGKGTGLGLSISYGIIKESKGTIKIKETSPEGTLFQIVLPGVA
ncbi:histidine kinase [Desulfocicer vacuolatum DSM 3385]|uniref:histidine kinase n=1 Tax=Desulfocicer vacuolatum DSM 3385 TaxID=1121400 RepID=A0A1W2AJI9_9BACT|nr:ATP-binding protein [Desulfocicer vacuolatum]SMC60682.1 histidine kinase [Desulfocicer vacuolatum DSM 3385]